MGFFGFQTGSDINKGVEEWKNTAGAVLLDVRQEDEYRRGHIPGSINIPVNELPKAINRIPGKDTPLFVHCLSGSRSNRAVRFLKQMGYTNVKNIGGINSYTGKTEV